MALRRNNPLLEIRKCIPLLFAAAPVIMGQVGANPETPKAVVTLQTATLLLSGKNDTAMNVSLHIDYAGKPQVWISGIGNVAKDQDLNFVARTKQLQIREYKGGPLLAIIELSPTNAHKAFTSSPDDLFPSMNPQQWTRFGIDLDLHRPISRVAPALFRLGQDASLPITLNLTACRLEDDGCLVSLWSKISMSSDDIQIECSLMFSYKPVNSSTAHFTSGTLAFSTRDGFATSSKWRQAPSSESVGKCREVSQKVQKALLDLPYESGR